MPSYDFDCNDCGHSFEAAVDYEMRNMVDCEACQGSTTIAWRKSQKPVLFREDNLPFIKNKFLFEPFCSPPFFLILNFKPYF